ncbi:hypothetical protein EOPP23_06740 [Endozoicomonas sp. OPT23]|uniref:SET domain-containing protein-lysine N-methyltransferase n=1 Tax=Endozoicomonas sp. OPT23 TaxID=2072845 RepID=UPI00129B64E5|nr:SET domain-containing protein-lysine N-methyltransferase [Endozoicomonas sp. OPT23]MRI32683.1 hypothetical protein [Endozoicomonas sp. OPT23]
MPRIAPPSDSKPSSQKSSTYQTSSVERVKSHDRIAKPKFGNARYHVSPKTTLRQLWASDTRIGSEHFWVQKGDSTLKDSDRPGAKPIGMGSFACQEFQKNQLIGCVKGKPVYLLYNEQQPVYFTIESGKVRLLRSIEHCIFAENVCTRTKQGDKYLKVSLGFQVEGDLKYINHSSSYPNVRTRTFFPHELINNSASTPEQTVLKSGVSLEENVAIALIANRPIKPANELFLDYSPDSDSIDFNEMNQCPAVELNQSMLEQLFAAAKKVAPKQSAFKVNPSSITPDNYDAWLTVDEPLQPPHKTPLKKELRLEIKPVRPIKRQ